MDYNFTINLTEEQIEYLSLVKKSDLCGTSEQLLEDIFDQIEPTYLVFLEEEKEKAAEKEEAENLPPTWEEQNNEITV